MSFEDPFIGIACQANPRAPKGQRFLRPPRSSTRTLIPRRNRREMAQMVPDARKATEDGRRHR
jgi:hypothetical protein